MTGLVVFSFGSPHWTNANLRLAESALELSSARNIEQIICQRWIKFNFSSSRIIREDEKKLSDTTLNFAQQVVRWCNEKGIKKLFVIAAPPHRKRCVRDLTMLLADSGLKIDLEEYKGDDSLVEEIWFNKESTKKATKNIYIWWIREYFITFLPWSLYKKSRSI